MSETELYVAKETSVEYPDICDGCGHRFKVGELCLTGIQSCCGGCVRCLCVDCLQTGMDMFNKAREGDIKDVYCGGAE